MYLGSEFGPIWPITNASPGIDFINDLAAGDSVINATCALSVETGSDPTPSARLFGNPSINPPSVVIQNVANLVPGTTYLLQMIANTANGDTLSLYSRIPDRPVY